MDAYYDGNRPAFEAEIDQGIKLESLATEFKSSTTTHVTSSYFYRVVKEQEREENSDWAPGKELCSLYESFVPTPDLARMDKFREIVHERLTYFKTNFKNKDAMASCSFIHTGGKAAQKQNKDTAYRWRPTKFHAYIIVRWKGLFIGKTMTEFFKDFRAKLRPYSVKKNAAFYNFPNNVPADKTNHDHEGAYFGNNKAALQKVKQIWDEGDYFHWDQGVRLPGQGNDDLIDPQVEADQEWEDFPINDDPDDWPGRIESA
jgi:hypothetical protein